MTNSEEQFRILHCFADHGTEAEVLGGYGDVVRVDLIGLDVVEHEKYDRDEDTADQEKDDLPGGQFERRGDEHPHQCDHGKHEETEVFEKLFHSFR